MMQEQKLFEFAVIRFLPKVEREEFINVGIIVFSKKEKYLKLKYFLNEKKINCFVHNFDLNFIESNLRAMQNIANGNDYFSPISNFSIDQRFRWLTATRSSCIQTSKPHPGLCYNLDHVLEKLFKNIVI